jgi:ankyrin repeat protein
LKHDVLAGTEYPYDKDLPALLHTSDLTGLVASGLSLEDILAAATLSNDHDIVRSCLEAGAQVTDAVQLKAQQGAELEVCRLLAPAGLDVNRDFDHIGSPITEAVISKDVERITFLLENGANPNIGSCLGRDSLMLALVDNLPLDVIKLLIGHGAEFPRKGLLPLAAMHGDVEVVDFLLENGAGPDEKIEEDICAAPGLTGSARHLSAERGYLDVVKLLLLRGADAGLVDSKGKTSTDRAALAGQARALSIIENWQP